MFKQHVQVNCWANIYNVLVIGLSAFLWLIFKHFENNRQKRSWTLIGNLILAPDLWIVITFKIFKESGNILCSMDRSKEIIGKERISNAVFKK